MTETKCKSCNCQCHCSVVSHSDMLGICPCQMCKCDSKGVTVDDTKECETCQQTKQNAVIRTLKKKKTTASAVRQKTKKKQRSKMNKLFLVLALLFALSACSVGKKCTYTQDGTKISSYVWFFQGDKPIDLDKNNCTQEFMEIDEVLVYIFSTDTIGVFNKSYSRIHPV